MALLFCLIHAESAKVRLSVCQGPFCSKYGCKNVLQAAKSSGKLAVNARGCFGKQGCETAFPKQGVTVSAEGLGFKTLKGCENSATAKASVNSICNAFGL